MLVVSNYLLDKTDLKFPEDTVIRVNVAWLKTQEELDSLLDNIDHDVYLDYPQGRTKPPTPKISLVQTIAKAHKFLHVKYFAVSNVEDAEAISRIKERLPSRIEVVPKIETEKGVENLEKIVQSIKTNYIMLDKDDLYIDVKQDTKKFEKLINLTRSKSKKLGIHVLELHGVIFQ